MRPSGMQVSGGGQIPRAKGIRQVPPERPGRQQQLPQRPSYKFLQPQAHPGAAPTRQQERFQPPICIPVMLTPFSQIQPSLTGQQIIYMKYKNNLLKQWRNILITQQILNKNAFSGNTVVLREFICYFGVPLYFKSLESSILQEQLILRLCCM